MYLGEKFRRKVQERGLGEGFRRKFRGLVKEQVHEKRSTEEFRRRVHKKCS